MRVPKWFTKWYITWGVMGDRLPPGYLQGVGLRIAWRAYRKGKKDYEDKPKVEGG